MTQPNPSTAQARALVDEFHRQGVRLAIISPGSRSAAMSIAFSSHPGIDARVVLDERSAAFRAVGYARATGIPAVCVCTSGTAVANYLPAVVEAHEGLVPFIAITADRPPELRQVGSNQSIDQTGIFSGWVRWACDLGLASSDQDDNNYWRTTVAQAMARARGYGGAPGPVHLNIGFREPTVPVPDDGRAATTPFPFSIEGRPDGAAWQGIRQGRIGAAELDGAETPKGVIVAGSGVSDPVGLVRQAERLGWPIVATALSGLRAFDSITSYHHMLVDGVPSALVPEVVVSIGATGPSDRLSELAKSSARHIQIDEYGRWLDSRRGAREMVHADPVATLALVGRDFDPSWAKAWRSLDQAVRSALDERLDKAGVLGGPSVARHLAAVDWGVLAVASSMPVRDVDAHMVAGGHVISNRGASGIDGFISTILGAAAGSDKVVGLSGDLAFLHDLSALSHPVVEDATLVVIDNNGGGLFDLLPQAVHAPNYESLFVAPHQRDLLAIGEALKVGARAVTSPEELQVAIHAGLVSAGLTMVVVRVDREVELKQRRDLDQVASEVARSMA